MSNRFLMNHCDLFGSSEIHWWISDESLMKLSLSLINPRWIFDYKDGFLRTRMNLWWLGWISWMNLCWLWIRLWKLWYQSHVEMLTEITNLCSSDMNNISNFNLKQVFAHTSVSTDISYCQLLPSQITLRLLNTNGVRQYKLIQRSSR